MANICENSFFLSNEGSNENFLKIKHRLIEAIDTELGEFYGELNYDEDEFMEGWFDSRWVFPIEKFKQIIPNGTEGIYFRCLSEEMGCMYIAMNVFKDGKWWDEQTFDF